MKVNGITDAQLQVKGVAFDRTLGGIEMELRLRDHLVKVGFVFQFSVDPFKFTNNQTCLNAIFVIKQSLKKV